MNNQIEYLAQYKAAIIRLGKTPVEKRFIEDSFTRWFFNAPKKDLIPTKNVVIPDDLFFANQHKKCQFDVADFVRLSNSEFQRLRKIKIAADEQYANKDHLISREQLVRLELLYPSKYKTFENDKNKLVAIYEFVGINSAHLSIPPKIFTTVKPVECFGSPLNTSYKFCSPFAFEKARFGSLGSFFSLRIAAMENILFTANPPFDEEIMTKMATFLIKELDAARLDKTIIITLPVWDSESQRRLGIRDFGMKFEARDILMASKFMKESDILGRNDYPYWDYYKQEYAPVSYSHLIILANGVPMLTIQEIKRRWGELQN